ncbi:MAG: 2,3-bisphosphoglycerate-independent phosphoglycerate mutase [Acidobacteria bacterium]|nr:2,3-bisphosphoglycerate-independent phosphoglycerate mutase [Acidobacteriota bacterium]
MTLVLVVLDGWGLREDRDHNAIALARTPTYTALLERYPHASLVASGEAVGLPAGQMGNSEVGHMNIGAGRIVYQDLTRIDKSIKDGDFFDNAALAAAMARCAGDAHALHLIGLVSDGGVHSHQRHLHALIEMVARRGVRRVFVHAITDGRDTPPIGGAAYLRQLEQVMERSRTGRVATIIGRYYAMDRDRRWNRTRRAYDLMTRGVGHTGPSAVALVERSYAADVTDEFIEPAAVVDPDGRPIGTIGGEDSIVFFNFRADRARQLTRALAFAEFTEFERTVHPRVHYTTMTVYDATFGLPAAFPPQEFAGAMAEVMAARVLTNLRLAETEKYAHVTYFFNCGEERPYPGEDRILVPSPQVATYDLQPEMSANGITETLVADLQNPGHQVIICNFANADMVGHTGRLEAAITAVETLDRCLSRITAAVREAGGVLLITADHGNAEQMWDYERHCPHTAHTSNRVPVVLVDERARGLKLRDGSLSDVAPTMLGILEIDPPGEMTGADLRTGALRSDRRPSQALT